MYIFGRVDNDIRICSLTHIKIFDRILIVGITWASPEPPVCHRSICQSFWILLKHSQCQLILYSFIPVTANIFAWFFAYIKAHVFVTEIRIYQTYSPPPLFFVICRLGVSLVLTRKVYSLRMGAREASQGEGEEKSHELSYPQLHC